jgi:hypothetical protein
MSRFHKMVLPHSTNSIIIIYSFRDHQMAAVVGDRPPSTHGPGTSQTILSRRRHHCRSQSLRPFLMKTPVFRPTTICTSSFRRPQRLHLRGLRPKFRPNYPRPLHLCRPDHRNSSNNRLVYHMSSFGLLCRWSCPPVTRGTIWKTSSRLAKVRLESFALPRRSTA